MGTKKCKKVAKVEDPATEVKTAEVQVQQKSETEKVKAKAKAKAKSEIDDIFGQKKRKNADGEDVDAAQAAAKKKEKDNSEVVKLNSKGELVKPKKLKSSVKSTVSAKSTSAAPTSRKKTEDGFTVYSAEELGFNKKNAGGTALCPFDCHCCF